MENQEEGQADELAARANRKCYLVTYSNADLCKFPTRQSFANAVLQAFSQGLLCSANIA